MFASIYKALSAIGYSHPIHTPMTSLPLGMVMGALVFALVGFASKRSGIRATARHCATLASHRSKRAKYAQSSGGLKQVRRKISRLTMEINAAITVAGQSLLRIDPVVSNSC
jgi:uncharacterized membrane protein